MLALENSYIGSIVAVVHFEHDASIRLQQANLERLFKPIIGTDSENLNVPDDAPAQIPRVFFRLSPTGFQMTVTQTSCQLDWQLTGKPGELQKQFGEIRALIPRFEQALLEFKSPAHIRECVLIVLIRCPDPRPDEELSAEFAKHFLNIRGDVPPNSGSFKAVFHKSEAFFLNIEGDTYKLTARVTEDAGHVPTKAVGKSLESGVLVKIDVNTKLQNARDGKFTFLGLVPLVSEVETFIGKQFHDIFSAK